MPGYINAGYNNLAARDRIVAVLAAGSLPCKRLVQIQKDENTALDATAGNKMKSVIVFDNGSIMIAAVSVSTILGRLNGGNKAMPDVVEKE